MLEAFLANLTSIPINNPGFQSAYNAIANLDKANPYKSKGMESARLDQLDQQQKQRFYNFAQYRVLIYF